MSRSRLTACNSVVRQWLQKMGVSVLHEDLPEQMIADFVVSLPLGMRTPISPGSGVHLEAIMIFQKVEHWYETRGIPTHTDMVILFTVFSAGSRAISDMAFLVCNIARSFIADREPKAEICSLSFETQKDKGVGYVAFTGVSPFWFIRAETTPMFDIMQDCPDSFIMTWPLCRNDLSCKFHIEDTLSRARPLEVLEDIIRQLSPVALDSLSRSCKMFQLVANTLKAHWHTFNYAVGRFFTSDEQKREFRDLMKATGLLVSGEAALDFFVHATTGTELHALSNVLQCLLVGDWFLTHGYFFAPNDFQLNSFQDDFASLQITDAINTTPIQHGDNEEIRHTHMECIKRTMLIRLQSPMERSDSLAIQKQSNRGLEVIHRPSALDCTNITSSFSFLSPRHIGDEHCYIVPFENTADDTSQPDFFDCHSWSMAYTTRYNLFLTKMIRPAGPTPSFVVSPDDKALIMAQFAVIGNLVSNGLLAVEVAVLTIQQFIRDWKRHRTRGNNKAFVHFGTIRTALDSQYGPIIIPAYIAQDLFEFIITVHAHFRQISMASWHRFLAGTSIIDRPV
ncbi:hypothetical protein C8J55DRAFT_561072 [Lentinula edodes]|uniref:F-box domain-containing protein n=1 Tax=Lentinula lateritia TaxID=40482 RepID=A0A9W9DPG4_9AGAR|nr:hypothetical protein C8J55DRAFT_561072 [Lentinula edodes]